MPIKPDTFPSQWKVTKIKPLFKNGIKTEVKNYTPISPLPLISKVRKIHARSNARLSSRK